MVLSTPIIDRLIDRSKQLAYRCYQLKDYEGCVSYITATAYLKYSFFYGYIDEDLEFLCTKLSNQIHQSKGIFAPHKKTIAFYDSFTIDNRGLTQQYLDALISNGYNIIYICRKDIKDESCAWIRKTLNNYQKVQVIQVPLGMKHMEEAQWIYDTIIHVAPSKLCMHLIPEAAIECIAFNALPQGLVKYQINLTDHTFWLGKSCMDFSFEFRPYGCNLSYFRRGLKNDQLLLMPFYPFVNYQSFKGFPINATNKVIFLSGGNYYKVIDQEDTFFKLCKNILASCPNAIILFAGSGDNPSLISEMANKYNINDRLVPIGNRTDIYECFQHSDIYINTYPIGGGLMCQYAAYCSKPILNYKISQIEDCVAQKNACSFTYYTEAEFVAEAIRLYKDSKYREEQGSLMHSAIVTKEEFEIAFKESLENHLSPYHFSINAKFQPKYYDINNSISNANSSQHFKYYMWQILRHRLIFLSLKLYSDIVKILVLNKLNISISNDLH